MSYVIGRTDQINNSYRVGKVLGKPGQFGVAKEAVHKKTGAVRAVKIIGKSKFSSLQNKRAFFEELRGEIDILSKAEHPNVIKMYEVFEDSLNLYLVLEHCAGGELFDRITERGSYSEKDASVVLKQIVKAILYLHQNNIAHCDLKPDNFMFADPAEDSTLKVIDFGMSKVLKDRRKYFRQMCGTPYYVAPEVIRGQYRESCDMWSIGVVMFVMLYGYPPFYADPAVYGAGENEAIFALVEKGFKAESRPGYGAWFPQAIKVSESARDLMTKLLKKDVAERWTAEEALEHPWLQGETASDTPLNSSVLQSLKQFNQSCKFKTRVLEFMADSLNDDQVEKLKSTFNSIDTDNNGVITRTELKDALEQLDDSVSKLELETIFDKLDIDKDGTISYKELMLSIINKQLAAKEERLWKTFRRLDADGNGRLSQDELKNALGENDTDVSALIAEVDVDGDGCVDYEEFLAMWYDKK